MNKTISFPVFKTDSKEAIALAAQAAKEAAQKVLAESRTGATKHVLRIYQDTYAENPRTVWDNFGKFYMKHRDYDFGDKNAENIDPETFDGVALSVFAYIHSGITIRTNGFNCPWDSGQIGVIYADKKSVIEGFGSFDEEAQKKALDCLKYEIETLDQWLTGQVYGYVLFDPQGNEIDSCSGFYGPKETSGILDCVHGLNYEVEHEF